MLSLYVYCSLPVHKCLLCSAVKTNVRCNSVVEIFTQQVCILNPRVLSFDIAALTQTFKEQNSKWAMEEFKRVFKKNRKAQDEKKLSFLYCSISVGASQPEGCIEGMSLGGFRQGSGIWIMTPIQY